MQYFSRKKNGERGKKKKKKKRTPSASFQLLKITRTNQTIVPKIRRQQFKGHMDLLKTNDMKPLPFSLCQALGEEKLEMSFILIYTKPY